MTHGTFKNKQTGVEITGERGYINGDRDMTVKFDGTTMSNMMRVADWDFTPDVPPLPTVPGLYSIYPADDDRIGIDVYYVLTTDLEWKKFFFSDAASYAVDKTHVAMQTLYPIHIRGGIK